METPIVEETDNKVVHDSVPGFSFSDIVDIAQLQKLLTSFSHLTGLTIGVVDQNSNILAVAGWKNICKNFHRVNPESAKYCSESDSTINQHLLTQNSITYKCKNGLCDIGYPIVVQGQHIATILFGQFFMDEKDRDKKRFELQAEKFDFDKTAYFKALQDVPVFSLEKVEHMKNFIVTQAHILTQTGYANLLLKQEKTEELKKFNDILKDLVQKTFNLNATKDKFFSIIAHDLRNPFAGILSSSTLLTTYLKNQNYVKAEEKAKMIIGASKHAYSLLENLLEWAKSQTGDIKFNSENLNIKSIVNECLEEVEELANNKTIRLINNTHGDLHFKADQYMLRLILRNLVTNAIKFTKSGGSIIIKATKYDDATEIAVIDTGIGIAKEHHDKIFRIDTKHTTLGTANEGGSSLGLILCKEFVEKHNGKLWVESEIDKGSEFKFTIPNVN